MRRLQVCRAQKQLKAWVIHTYLLSNFNILRYLSYSIKISVYFYGFLYNLQKSAKCNDSYTFHFRCKRIYPQYTHKTQTTLIIKPMTCKLTRAYNPCPGEFQIISHILCLHCAKSHLQNPSRITCYALLTNATNVILSGFVNNPGYKFPAFLHFLYVTFTAPSNWLVLLWLSSLSSLLYTVFYYYF